jgi:hypothetical protein
VKLDEMRVLHTATFTIGLEGVSDDELEAAAAAFTCTLHRSGLTPVDAIDAWQATDAWAEQSFAPAHHPGIAWRRTMTVAQEALVAALRAAGVEGRRPPFVIQACWHYR